MGATAMSVWSVIIQGGEQVEGLNEDDSVKVRFPHQGFVPCQHATAHWFRVHMLYTPDRLHSLRHRCRLGRCSLTPTLAFNPPTCNHPPRQSADDVLHTAAVLLITSDHLGPTAPNHTTHPGHGPVACRSPQPVHRARPTRPPPTRPTPTPHPATSMRMATT